MTPRTTPPEVLLEVRRAARHSRRGTHLGKLVAIEMLRTLSITYDPADEDALIEVAGAAFAKALKKLATRQNRELQNAVDILSGDLERYRNRYERLARVVVLEAPGLAGHIEGL